MTSAIEQICAMLDERGVEYDFTDRLFEIPSYQSVTWWYNTADKATFREYHDGSTQLIVHSSKHGITPEEAIAATLGPVVRHPKPHEQWTTVLLPEIAWGLDDRWPDYLSVAHDAHGEWRVYVPEATLGRGECHNEAAPNCRDYWFCCSECEFVAHTNKTVINYCPNCGARVVEVSNG